MGNKLGWIIAAVLGGFVLFLIVKLVFFPSVTPPNYLTTDPGRLDLKAPAQPVTLVLPAEPSGPGDAGDDYLAALKLFKDTKPALIAAMSRYSNKQPTNTSSAYQGALERKYNLTEEDVWALKKVADLVSAAAAKKTMTYYFRLTPKKIQPEYWPMDAEGSQSLMDAFQSLMDPSLLLSVHYLGTGPEGYAQAERYLFDIFTVGYHLINERARMDLVLHGVGLEKEACNALTVFYTQINKPERIEQLNRYVGGLVDLSSTYGDLYKRVLWKWDPQPSGLRGPHPGNIFNLAANHKDRCVRAEATIALGVVKFSSDGRGDANRCRELISRKLADRDELERAAAQAASDLTAEGRRQLLRGKSS